MRWRKSHIVYIDVRWLVLKVVVAVLLAVALSAYLKWTRVTLIEFESTDLAASWRISDPAVIREVSGALRQATPVIPAKGGPPRTGGITMRLTSQRETREYIFTDPGLLFDRKKDRLLKTPERLNRVLQLAAGELRRRSPFGELVEWEEVNKVFPVGSEAGVMDLDTGRKFLVRRTGGYSHADVEPLTGRDTATVKMLYGGTWSWKRRAAVVETGGRKIAASLAGMPQGKGELKNNDCYGTIHLYFFGRATEKSSNLSHLTMIWKAAGKTREKLRGLSPEETLLVLFTALDQRDLKTLEQIVTPAAGIDRTRIREVIGVTITGMRKQGELVYQLTVLVSLQNGPYNQSRQVQVRLSRDQDLDIYRVEGAFLPALLRQGK